MDEYGAFHLFVKRTKDGMCFLSTLNECRAQNSEKDKTTLDGEKTDSKRGEWHGKTLH